MTLPTFIPLANGRITPEEAEAWDLSPYCECHKKCDEYLPKQAWLFAGSNDNQYVVLPGHQKPGAEIFEMDGFVIEKDDES